MKLKDFFFGILIAFLLWGSLVARAQEPARGRDAGEALRSEIRLINLVNGLELTPEQTALILQKAEAVRVRSEEFRASETIRQREIVPVLKDIRGLRLKSQDVPPELARRFHDLDKESKQDKIRLADMLQECAAEIEKSLASHQLYALEQYVPCVIPPKGESRVGQALDVRGIAGRLAKVREIPERQFQWRRGPLVDRTVAESRLTFGPRPAPEGSSELAEKLGLFFDKVRRLSSVDFEIQKESLAGEFASLVKPKKEALGTTRIIEAFLLSPDVIPILSQRLR